MICMYLQHHAQGMDLFLDLNFIGDRCTCGRGLMLGTQEGGESNRKGKDLNP